MSVVIETNLGSLSVRLFTKEAPLACFSFLKLSLLKYYNWCLFHRIEKDFIAQTGDPTGTGKGGHSIYNLFPPSGQPSHRFFEDEIHPVDKHPELSLARRGILAMANSGRNKNASQFFLTLADDLGYLDGKYTVFGKVIIDNDDGGASRSVLEAINGIVCDEAGRPLEKVWIREIRVLEDPFPDPDGFVRPTANPPPTSAFESCLLPEARVPGTEEPTTSTQELSKEAIEAKRRRDEASAQALTLEMLGDLPSANVAPPENVLFVCRLNPLTQSTDLRTIFSRFGSILSCQVITDRDTGDSLCYAFIEFAEREACEEAYLKMDNVLIDDRRIRVDFSQSVSKLHSAWRKDNEARRFNGKDNSGYQQTRPRDRSPCDDSRRGIRRDSREDNDRYRRKQKSPGDRYDRYRRHHDDRR